MLESNQGQSNEIKLSIAQQHSQEEISSPSPGFIAVPPPLPISPPNTISVSLISVTAEANCNVIQWAAQQKIDNVDKVHEKQAVHATALLIQWPSI